MDLLTLLHPKLVHFPIAFFFGAWFLDVVSLLSKKEPVYKAAVYVYIMAAFSSAAAVASGLWEADRLNVHHPLMYTHRNFAFAVLGVSWTGLILIYILGKQPQAARLVFTCACWLAAALVLAASYFGGEMVFGYGVGVHL